MKKGIILLTLVSFVVCLPAQAIKPKNWDTVFSGYGYTKIKKHKIILKPKTSTQEDETHAALVVGPELQYPFSYRLTIKTKKQLRENSEPNAWEMAWVVWHYTDNDHFYYLILKPNGWELGKRDPNYDGGQRFLATGSKKTYKVDKEYKVKVIQRKKTIKVYVDGKRIVKFKDNEDPYKKGRLGVYTEDAKARFTNIKRKQLEKK